jgi:Zn-dependent protease
VNHLALLLLVAGVPAILAITLHEAAHGYAALALGDDTARRAGRLSLNPIRHIDPFGTILLPGFLLFVQLMTIGRVAFMFGWAKPVPVAAWRFRNPRRGMALVAAAGPAMNFFLAWLGALGLRAIGYPFPFSPLLADALIYFILTNLVLGLFNLLPIPPLDGGRIAVGILPERLALRWAGLERAGLAIVLLLIFVVPEVLRHFGTEFDPVNTVLNNVLMHAVGVTLRLAGVHDVT